MINLVHIYSINFYKERKNVLNKDGYNKNEKLDKKCMMNDLNTKGKQLIHSGSNNNTRDTLLKRNNNEKRERKQQVDMKVDELIKPKECDNYKDKTEHKNQLSGS